MPRSNYKVLFHFENEELIIVEIKRNNIVSDDKSKIYYWLLQDKANDLLTHLSFVSMKKDENFEYRQFKDSSLHFDNAGAVFEHQNTIYNLKNIDAELALPEHANAIINNYLTQN